jgi:hypothetical protein
MKIVIRVQRARANIYKARMARSLRSLTACCLCKPAMATPSSSAVGQRAARARRDRAGRTDGLRALITMQSIDWKSEWFPIEDATYLVRGRSRGIQDAGISGRMPLWRSRNNLSHQHRSHVLAPAARRLFVLSAPWGGWDIGPGGQSLHRHRESLQGSVLSFRTSDRGFLDLR